MPGNKPWATKELRQKYLANLSSALQNINKNESAEDLEQQILDKSNTADEYSYNISKVLVVCKEKAQAQTSHHMTNMPPGMHHMQPGQMHMVRAQIPGQMNQNMNMGHMGQMNPNQMNPNQMNQVQMTQIQMNPGQMNPGQMNPAQMNPAQINPMQMTQVRMAPGQMKPGQMNPNPINNQQMRPGMPVAMMMPRRQHPGLDPVSPHVMQQQDDENTMYNVKLAELQRKYIVPLQKLKDKTNEHKKNEMKRIHEILDILMTNKKVKLITLVNVENVLDKLFRSSEQGSVEKAPSSADKAANGSVEKQPHNNKHFCQPLIDEVANHACNSSLYHTIRRTFGPALYNLHGDVAMYPPAKRPKKGEPTTVEILDSEISRLPKCFKANVKNRSRGDLEVHVKHLKSKIVPYLTVVIPKKYPEQSPWIKETHNKIGKQVERELQNKLVTLSLNYSLTQILLCWKNCILKVLANGFVSTAP